MARWPEGDSLNLNRYRITEHLLGTSLLIENRFVHGIQNVLLCLPLN